jgi:hypothetical protein
VAAQPFNTSFRLPSPRRTDDDIGEFWVENVADFERIPEYNLSMYERNRFFKNCGGGRLVDASYVSGTDLTSDSRAVAVGDLDEDGRPDLVVRNCGGGPVRIFLNRIPGGQALTVTLRGSRSNLQGIGARLVLEVGGRKLYREHFPQNSLMAQNACETIFGLGESPGPARLTVTWPSGLVQVLEALEPGRLEVREPEE